MIARAAFAEVCAGRQRDVRFRQGACAERHRIQAGVLDAEVNVEGAIGWNWDRQAELFQPGEYQ